MASNRFRPIRWALDGTSATYVVALILAPVCLLAINRSWIFTQVGWLDPWIYSGYHMHLASLWRDFPNAYFGARLPWTVVGWVIYRIAPVEAYLYILALLLFYLATFSLFYTIKSIFDNAAAGFVAAWLLGTNSWFLCSIGWHYIDGPMIALILLSFAAITGTARGARWRAASVLWGATTAATIALFTPNFDLLPIYAGVFIALNHFGERRPIAMVAFLWGAGFLSAALAMSLSNWVLGGHFLFFMPQVAQTLGSFSLRASMPEWYLTLWSAPWILATGFAFFASVALIAALGPCVLRGLRRGLRLTREGNLMTLAVACVVATLGFVSMEGMRFGMLTWFYHANELLPFAFLVFGGCLAVGMSRFPRAFGLPFAIAAPILCLAPWVLATMQWIHVPLPINAVNEPRLFSGYIVEPLWMLAGAGLVFGAAVARNWVMPVALTAFLSTISVLTITNYGTINLGDDGSLRNRNLAIYRLAGIIDNTKPTHLLPIWWDSNDRENLLFISLREMMNLGYDRPHAAIVPGDRLIFLSSGGTRSRAESDLLASQHFGLAPVVQEHVQYGTIGIDIAIEDVTSK